jgi:hypothetical protein
VKELTLQNKIASVTCYADSKLMVSQLTVPIKIKHPDMKRLAAQIKLLENGDRHRSGIPHVMRENKTEADALVKSTLRPELHLYPHGHYDVNEVFPFFTLNTTGASGRSISIQSYCLKYCWEVQENRR